MTASAASSSKAGTGALNETMILRMKSILEEIRKLVEEKDKVDNFDYGFDNSSLVGISLHYENETA